MECVGSFQSPPGPAPPPPTASFSVLSHLRALSSQSPSHARGAATTVQDTPPLPALIMNRGRRLRLPAALTSGSAAAAENGDATFRAQRVQRVQRRPRSRGHWPP